MHVQFMRLNGMCFAMPSIMSALAMENHQALKQRWN